MAAPWASEYVVRDILIGPDPSPFRWTTERPELKFRVTGAGPWKLVVNFAVAETTFLTTGPVTIEFFIDANSLGSSVCNRHGPYRFEKDVPPGWLKPGTDTHVSAFADRKWTSPQDGARLSFLLVDAGLFPR